MGHLTAEAQRVMKEPTWDHPNKMHVDSGHKTWDRYANLVTDGNIIANGWYGFHIRAVLDEGEGLVDYPENKRAPGYLQKWDLDRYFYLNHPAAHGIRGRILKWMAANPTEAIWLYCAVGPKGDVVHGFILVGEGEDHPLIDAYYTGPTWKSKRVIDWCIPYVTGRRP